MKWKGYVGVLILVLTVGLFIWYFRNHPSLLAELGELRLSTIALLVGLYFIALLPIIFILQFTVELCGVTLPKKELVLLTIYSSIANFFGPLQSGPVFRAVYLQRRHGIKLKDYTVASLFYYALLAFFSAAFLLLSSQLWWLAALGLLVAVGIGGVYLKRRASTDTHLQLRSGTIIRLGLATLVQVTFLAVIYFNELRLIQHSVNFNQAISYAGAANFSLFVALTPGAIGIRESFLLASQQLHHLTNSTIIAASVIDRAVYILFLVVLFGVALLTHARDRLGLNQAQP